MIHFLTKATPNLQGHQFSQLASPDKASDECSPEALLIDKATAAHSTESIPQLDELDSGVPELSSAESKAPDASEPSTIQMDANAAAPVKAATLVNSDLHDYAKDADNFARAVAKAKTEQYKATAIRVAVEKICKKSIKLLNEKADGLTASLAIVYYGTACDPTSQDFDKKVYFESYWPIFQDVLKDVSLDFSNTAEVKNKAIELVDKGPYDFDDYFATVYSDSLKVFKSTFDSNDFSLKSYSFLLTEINQQYLG